MPELPEVRAHAERLDASFSGAVITGFRALHIAALKSFDPSPDVANGLAVTSVGHRGKLILIRLSGPDPLTFVVHLMQGGRLRPDPKKSKRPRGGMARWEFEDGGALLLTEAGTEHRAGVWLVAGDPDSVEPLDHLGPDAHTVGRTQLAAILAGESERLHGFLRNQRRMAGLGRLLANEILHSARLSPFANTARLDDDEIDRLHAAIGSKVTTSLDHERTLDDLGRSRDRPSDVHHRIGEDCPVCGDTILSIEYRRYTIAYCPTCQTDGRKLADNTTSKFLK